jgi:hypothetical protein
MAKEFKRTVLYEVIKRKCGKVPVSKELATPHSVESVQSSAIKPKPKSEADSSRQEDQAAGGREPQIAITPFVRKCGLLISLPIAGLLVVVIVAALFGAFRLGQFYGPKERRLFASGAVNEDISIDSQDISPRQLPAEQPVAPKDSTSQQAGAAKEQLSRLAGDHVIVIATYKQGEDLAPVKEYFNKNGIETQIQERSGYFFLVTENKFQNPNREGTDGYFELQKIKKVGAKYKAPVDYETFAPNYFQDAYPMKIRLEGEVLDVY